MKKNIFLSLFLITAIFAKAQVATIVTHNDNSSAQVNAVVQEDGIAFKESEYNFGKIPQGKPVTHIFDITNTGKTAYKLDNVVASCGCTTPQWDKEKIINPGEKSIITVGYNAAAEGPFNKSITVTYNTNQTKVTVIKGEVWKTPAASAPTNAALNDFKN